MLIGSPATASLQSVNSRIVDKPEVVYRTPADRLVRVDRYLPIEGGIELRYYPVAETSKMDGVSPGLLDDGALSNEREAFVYFSI